MDSMANIWNYCYFNQLKIDPTEHPVHLTQFAETTKKSREDKTEIFFEKFSVPAFYLSIRAVLSLYSSGRTNGLVIDSGDLFTQLIPIYEGFTLKKSVSRMGLTGGNLTNHLVYLLSEYDYVLNKNVFQIANEIKKTKCYVAFDYNEELMAFH